MINPELWERVVAAQLRLASTQQGIEEFLHRLRDRDPEVYRALLDLLDHSLQRVF